MPQNPTRKLLILLETNGDVQLDQLAVACGENLVGRADLDAGGIKTQRVLAHRLTLISGTRHRRAEHPLLAGPFR
jgi:hypothetical protein